MAITKNKKTASKKAGRKPASKKGAGAKAVPKKAPVRKATAGASSKQGGSGKTAAKPRTAKPLAAREKLIAVKPSGSKEDNFFDLVHEVARQIPKGRVTSYGAIGAALGTRGSARMVGWAMMAVPYAEKPVPAHRVVNRAGLLTGRHHYNPPEKMQQLLEKEGVRVVDNTVVDFKTLFWDPSQEL
jgi:methylated-DNA-protein-cysteine methyltransferase-like protein